MATDAAIQEIILQELGLQDDQLLRTILPVFWDMFPDKEQFSRYLYTKIRVVSYLLGKNYKAVDIVSGFDEVKVSQKFRNLVELLKVLKDEIKTVDPYADIPYLISVQGTSSAPDAISEAVEYATYGYGLYSKFYQGGKA